MMPLVWSPAFTRMLKKRVRKNRSLRAVVERTLRQLSADPFHPVLRSHKLIGKLAGTWSCSVSYDLRIIFEFVENPDTGEEEILLLAVGTHDEVY
ncbi:MAG: type II toxin-antitoxin system mRNA interferase toxin, RelE/StbE family [Chloroflexi bacterium]|nr:type II toxin-antitoxin system mRNA interferase toxin, RelE/StbE family [Chloroflexota bacterium]